MPKMAKWNETFWVIFKQCGTVWKLTSYPYLVLEEWQYLLASSKCAKFLKKRWRGSRTSQHPRTQFCNDQIKLGGLLRSKLINKFTGFANVSKILSRFLWPQPPICTWPFLLGPFRLFPHYHWKLLDHQLQSVQVWLLWGRSGTRICALHLHCLIWKVKVKMHRSKDWWLDANMA